MSITKKFLSGLSMHQWSRDCCLRPTTLFIYALSVTIFAFVYRGVSLLIIAFLNGVLGLATGLKKPYLIKLFLVFNSLTIWGVFISSLSVIKYGDPVITIGFLSIRSGVIDAIVHTAARLISISGATLIFISLTDPYGVIKSLENDLRLPKVIVFPLAYGLRLLPLMKKDLEEINLCRVQRGFSKYPFTPRDLSSLLKPLIAISYERAIWTGVSIELRGFSFRRPWRFGFELKLLDYVFYVMLIIQAITPFILS